MEKLPPKPRKCKTTREELMKLDKDELIEKLLQMEAHNVQLKNIISKKISSNETGVIIDSQRKFDFTKCSWRRILLRIMYFGWDYQGLAVQEDTNQTIEHNLFRALSRTCLIESRETSNYHRCGRTDKGVSAAGQVISITVRSKHTKDQQMTEEGLTSELEYCKIINRLFPKEIRAVAWMPIPDDIPEYSARFDCKRRQYKYYFPQSNLNIAAMKDAGSRLAGSHDFRHLCKMDVGNGVTEFIRRVFRVDILPVDVKDLDSPTSMYCLVIEGNAFLWHQIRCIMGLLLLIGQGNEEPDVIDQLLDVEKVKSKPQYSMALDVPLNLFKCDYELENKQKWIFDEEELKVVIAHLQGEWTLQSIKATMIKDALIPLEEEYATLMGKSETGDDKERDSIMCHTDCLLQGVKSKVYKPLLKRDTCSSLEDRIEYYKKKRKVNMKGSSNEVLENGEEVNGLGLRE